MTNGEAILQLAQHPADDELYVASDPDCTSIHRVNEIISMVSPGRVGLIVCPRQAIVDIE